MRLNFLFLILISLSIFSQNIDLNNDFNNVLIRNSILLNKNSTVSSLNIRPLNSNLFNEVFEDQFKLLYVNKSESIQIKTLGVDYFIEYNSRHPYNRNNGTMIPNRGYQHIISPGFFFKMGPLSIQFKPEHHYSENKIFDGFWEGHFPEIWAKRYHLWNHVDIPERFGEKHHNKTTYGQSSVRLNWKNLSIGISNENLWWGPSIRNSIMLSNHASGFKHITFNTIKPIKTLIGDFEWQLISGRLENSGFTPPRTDFEYAGTKLYVPKINQSGWTDDWRYLQALIISYSPKFINGLSIGFIRWSQMYSALVRGYYHWMNGTPSYFPIFKNLFRKNDEFVDYEAQTDQAAGLFLNWRWIDSKARFYAEFHHNDSKYNMRDLLLDSDHSRAATIGLEKAFNIYDNDFIFNWEWTQMEQNASRLIRNAGSWYEHAWVYDGYTNKGEVLGSSIGPGSNSHYISLSKINNNTILGFAFELIDHDNDFYHVAFASKNNERGDFRRYWKDINIHLNFNKKFKSFSFSSSFVFVRSLNYQWELDDTATPYYHPGNDVNNFHLNLKFTYFGNW